MLKIIIFTLTLFLFSCIEKKVGNFAEIKTAGIQPEDEEFAIIGGHERGEFITNSDPAVIIAEFTNKSKFAYMDLSISISELPIELLKFTPTLDGKYLYPGNGGNCTNILYPGQTCQIHMTFYPTSVGALTQTITVNYKDLVESKSFSKKLNFFMGEAPFLVEVNDQRNYNFGTIERTLPDEVYTKLIRIQNIGGITARNLDIELSNTNEGAYSILENTCEMNLKANEFCDVLIALSSPNFGILDLDKVYASRLSIDYNKNSFNAIRPEIGRFGYDLTTFSSKVEGVLSINGAAGISFPEIIHGNKSTSGFQLRNSGSRDLILREMSVSNETGSLIARCRIEDNSKKLKCFDPIQTHIEMSLINFPFNFHDVDSCLYNFSNADYLEPTEELVGEFFVSPTTPNTTGKNCEFEVSYHSSIANTTDRSFNGWSIGFEYDSTYLGEKVIHSTSSSSGASVLIINASGIMAGSLYLSQFTFSGTTEVVTAPPYLLDAKRVTAVQSTSTAVVPAVFRLKNSSNKAGVNIISISTDSNNGTNFSITNSSKNINSYYTAVRMAAACKLNTSIITQNCDLNLNYSPKLPISNISNFGKGHADRGENFRRFKVVYTDGCTILDDGVSPCPTKELFFDFTSEIITRGNLQFGGPKQVGTAGTVKTQHEPGLLKRSANANILAGTSGWQHLWLTNIGSGPIKYIHFNPGQDLYTANGVIPFTIKPNQDGLESGEYDCADFLRGSPLADREAPVIGTTPIDFPAGASCRLHIEVQLRPNERMQLANHQLWDIPFYKGDLESREYLYAANYNRILSFIFYDGDLNSTEPSADFHPDLGEKRTIIGGSAGRWQIKVIFDYPGKLVPTTPFPATGAVLYRSVSEYTVNTKHPDSQWLNFNNPFTVGVVNPQVYNSSFFPGSQPSYQIHNVTEVPSFPADALFFSGLPHSGFKETFKYLNTTGDASALNFKNYALGSPPATDDPVEFVYYAGAFPHTTEGLTFSIFLDNKPTAAGLAPVTNVSETLSCISSPMDCSSGAKLVRGDYVLLSTIGGGASNVIDFKLNLGQSSVEDEIGRYESIHAISFKTPYEKSIRIKIIADIVAPDTKKFTITATDYICHTPNGTTCNSRVIDPDGVTGLDVTNEFLTTIAPAPTFKMNGVMGAPIMKQRDFVITNTGTSPIYDFKLFLRSSFQNPIVEYQTGLGISVSPAPVAATSAGNSNQFQCQNGAGVNGVLAVGSSCTITLGYRAVSATSLPQMIGISYKLLGVSDSNVRDGVYVSKYISGTFEGNDQANLVVFGRETNSKAINHNNQLIYSFPVRFNSYSQNNHPLMSGYPVQVIDSESLITDPVLQIFNQRAEKASFLKEYEKFVCGGTPGGCTPPNGANWIKFYEQNGISIEGNRACFYGSDTANPNIPEDNKGFNLNSAANNQPCLLRLAYSADLTKMGEISPQDTVVMLEYYSTARLVTKKIYLHLEGFIEPYRSIAAEANFSDVYSDSSGTVKVKWDPFTNEIANFGNVIKYRVYYTKSSDDLLKIYDSVKPGTLNFLDTDGVEHELEFNGLENSTIYYFRVVAIRRGETAPSSGSFIEYQSLAGNFLRQKIVVPPNGFAFDYKNRNLIHRYISENAVTKTVASNNCFAEKVRIDDQNIRHTKELKLLSNAVFAKIEEEKEDLEYYEGDGSQLVYSDYNFEDFPTWIDEIANLNNVFGPTYDCSRNAQFSVDGDIGYIKSCDNSDPEKFCCNMNVLNQMRGKPLASNPNLNVFYTNVDSLHANYRCFVNLHDELQ